MKTHDAIRYFGSQARLAKAIGISGPAVSQWGAIVPLASAARLEKLTSGALALALDDYSPSHKSAKTDPLQPSEDCAA